ncbi:MAG: pitrilysin family protein [Candidatus Ratteibacteria bacterium]|nr:pitrilysin family protein [Candidatus Ratteibacteria bacterium]
MRDKAYICLLILFLTGCATVTEKPYEKINLPELHKTEKPQFIKKTLDNGTTVFLMEDHSLPLISFKALIRTGKIHEPAEKTGLGDITFEVMRTGGAGEKTGDEIDLFLENIGASISTGIGTDIGWVEGICHKKNFFSVFNIFKDIITTPSFEPDKITLAVIKKKSEISRRNDYISEIADREFKRLIYGKDSPYGRIPEYETIDAITREDIINVYNFSVHPEDIILGIWGDFETEEMYEIVKRSFGRWQKEKTEKKEKPPVEFIQGPSLNIIKKEDATQSVIVMGHIGLQMNNPDYPAAVVLSRALGVGWNSRFLRILRQEKGLAYEVWAVFSGEFDRPGLFIAKAQTKTESTMEAMELMKAEIKRIQEGITKEELDIAKEGVINSEVFWSDTKDEIMSRILTYEYYNYPYDYPEKLIEGVKKVSLDDIKRTARKYIFPERLTILIVGNPPQPSFYKSPQFPPFIKGGIKKEFHLFEKEGIR